MPDPSAPPPLPSNDPVDIAARTAVAEGDATPQSWQNVGGVVYNRMQKSGRSAAQIVSEPNAFESYARGTLQSVDPNSPAYKSARAAVAPVFSGDVAVPYDSFYAPKLQASLGRGKPAFDDGTGHPIGSQLFFSGKYGGAPSGPTLPPQSDLDAAFGVQRGAPTPAPAQPSQAATTADAPSASLPPQADLDKAFHVNIPSSGAPGGGVHMGNSGQLHWDAAAGVTRLDDGTVYAVGNALDPKAISGAEADSDSRRQLNSSIGPDADIRDPEKVAAWNAAHPHMQQTYWAADDDPATVNAWLAAHPDDVSNQMARARTAAQAQIAKVPGWGPGFYNGVNAVEMGKAPLLSGAFGALQTGAQNALAGVGIGKAAPYTAGQAFTATRDATQGMVDQFQQQHPYVSTAENIAGMALSPEARLLGMGTAGLATRGLPALAESGGGRLAARALGNAAVGADYGASVGASHGESGGQIARDAATSGALAVPLGAAGEGLGAAARPVVGNLPGVLPRLVTGTVGAAAGAGYGATFGGGGKNIAQDAMLGGALGAGAGPRGALDAEPTPQNYATALDMVAKGATPEQLESSTLPTVAEAHPNGPALIKTAGAHGGGAPDQLAQSVAERQSPAAVSGRVAEAAPGVGGIAASDLPSKVADIAQAEQGRIQAARANIPTDVQGAVQDATGVHPAMAQANINDQVDTLKNTVAKPLWDKVDESAPTYTPEIAQLMAEPRVRAAVNFAKNYIGSGSLVDNPDIPKTSDGRQNVSAADYQDWLKTGNQQTDNLLNTGARPLQVPTAKTLIEAQRHLAGSVTRNPITGAVEPGAENQYNQMWSGKLNDAIKAAVPGLNEAKAASGDYLSAGDAYRSGLNLSASGRGAESDYDFGQRFPALTPGEQAATKNGYLADMYRQMQNSPNFNPDTFRTPFHQAVQETMFGAPARDQIQGQLDQASELRANTQLKGPYQKAIAATQSMFAPGVGKSEGALKPFADQHAAADPGVQKTMAASYLSTALQGLDSGKIKPADLMTPFHKAAQTTLLGVEGAAKLQDALSHEVDLEQSAKTITKAVQGSTPKPQQDHGGIAQGAVIGAVEGRGNPASIAHGALAGAGIKGAAGVIGSLANGSTTPGVRNALGEIINQDPQTTAAQIRARLEQRKSVPLSGSTMLDQIALAANRGAAVTGGHAAANALSGAFAPQPQR